MRPSWLQHLDQKWRPLRCHWRLCRASRVLECRLVLDLWDEYEHEFWETDPSDEGGDGCGFS